MAREIDDISKRKEYRKEQFDGKRSTIDEYSHDRIFCGNTADAAHKHPTNRTTDIDHITPLKVIQERYPKLTLEQQKELANKEYNLALTSSKRNRSKGDLENHKYLIRQIKKGESEDVQTSMTMISKEAVSRIAMRVDGSKMAADNAEEFIGNQTMGLPRTVESAMDRFVTGARDSLINSVIPLTAEATRHMIKMARGEEALKDAATDMGKTAVNVAVMNKGRQLLYDAVGASPLKNILGTSYATQLIMTAELVRSSAVRYLNGEIDGKGFIEECGEKGAVMVAGMIGGEIGTKIGGIIGTLALPIPGVGTAAGMIVGEILGTVITTVACSGVVAFIHTARQLNNFKLEEKAVRRIERAALKEMEMQRAHFREIAESELKRWNDTIQSGFDQIICCACETTYDLQGVTDGLDKILSLFGKEVRFKSLDDYKAQLDSALVFSF